MERRFKKNQLFAEMDENARIEALNTNSETIDEDYLYTNNLSEVQIKEKNVIVNQTINKVIALKDQRKAMNAEIAKLEKKYIENSIEVVKGVVEVTEKTWIINNYETGMAERINADAEVIDSWRFKEGSTMNLFNNQNKEAM
jgi:exonuclease I